MGFGGVDNRTLMTVLTERLDARDGREVLTVIAKMTWSVAPDGTVSVPIPGSPVRFYPEHRGDPHASSLRYASDLCAEKPGTDVILVATAHPPRDRQVTQIDVGLRIAARTPIARVARVFGPRVYQKGIMGVAPGPPATLRPTPLIWELAWGGPDRSDASLPILDARNPIGMGAASDRRMLAGLPAPQIEDIDRPCTARDPAPAGFGPIPAHWAPRAGFAGTYDEAWRRQRAPIAPADRDPRYECVSPPELWSAEPLLGDELIEVVGATPEGLWRFRLPRYSPLFSCAVMGEPRALPTHLDTLIVDAELGLVETVYRTSIPIARTVRAIERVIIEEEHMLPDELFPDVEYDDVGAEDLDDDGNEDAFALLEEASRP